MRYPDAASVHLLEWPTLSVRRRPTLAKAPPSPERGLGQTARPPHERHRAIAPLRRDKVVGSSLQSMSGCRKPIIRGPRRVVHHGPVSRADSLTVRKSDLNNAGVAGGICQRSPKTAACATAARDGSWGEPIPPSMGRWQRS